MKRRISSCVNVRIRAGDYQHIEVVKYAEEEVEYTSIEDLKAKEDALNDDVVDCLFRSLNSTAARLGQGKAQAIEVEETLSKAIPAWLANDPVPNIANGAKKILNTVGDKQKAEKDKATEAEKKLLGGDSKLVETPKENSDNVEVKAKEEIAETIVNDASTDDVDELFEPDEIDKADENEEVTPVEEGTEGTKEVKETETKESQVSDKDDEFDFFSEAEDVFGGK